MKATVIKLMDKTVMLQINHTIKVGGKTINSLKPDFVYIRNMDFAEGEELEVEGKVVDWKQVITTTGEQVMLKTLAAH